jgi:uncharacterized protein
LSESRNYSSNLQESSSTWSFIFPITVGAVGLFTMALIGYSLQVGYLSVLNVSAFKLVNFTFTMQLYVLPLSFIGLLYLYFYNKNSFHSFFKFQLNRGKEPSSNWKALGPIVLIAFAIGTSFFMSFNVLANKGAINETFWKLMPFVLLFSFTNAWTEEILSRFMIVGGLSGKLTPIAICWISAVIFGIPHFFSGGILSVMVSGLLGWLLAKSVIETQSLGWALLIHFLLDIIVFGAGAMILAGST